MKRAILFPGQGAQVVGMGRDLAEISDAATRVYNQANDVLGFDLAGLCFDGPAERLEQTDVQQPAILVTAVALWAALTQGGARAVPFDMAAGLSLGEYTALHLAGALSFEDAVRLVHRRGQYMQEAADAADSGMVSVLGLEPDEVEALCVEVAEGDILQAANFNCPGQIVVSGSTAACARIADRVEAGRGKAVVLKVAGAFHSPFMATAAERMRADLATVPFTAPAVPVLSNVDATPHRSPDDIRNALFQQVCSAVRWQACVERLIADGVEEFIEVGPGRSLAGMMRKIDRRRAVRSINTAAAVTEFTESLA